MILITKFWNKVLSNKKIIYRHFFVSSFCASTELLFFSALYKLPAFGITIAYIISFFIATIAGFLLHTFFTFSLGQVTLRSASLFFLQALLIFLFGYSILRILIFVGLHPIISKICQLFMTFSFNVIIGKNLTFRKKNA
jgi:hypothetical protein